MIDPAMTLTLSKLELSVLVASTLVVTSCNPSCDLGEDPSEEELPGGLTTIDELGVVVDLPVGWAYRPRKEWESGDHVLVHRVSTPDRRGQRCLRDPHAWGWRYKCYAVGPRYGARLRQSLEAPPTLLAATVDWTASRRGPQATLIDAGELSNGFYVILKSDWEDDWERHHVRVVIPHGSAAIECDGEIDEGLDPTPLIEVCGSVRPLDPKAE
jgi:hypothetical protein